MRLINLVDRVDSVNFGIWNAAISTAGPLWAAHDIASELWYPANAAEVPIFAEPILARPVQVGREAQCWKAARGAALNPCEDVVVTHGCWQYPTHWGAYLRAAGFRWVSVPHGMLEPWSMRQKRLRKRLFFSLVEGRLQRRATVCRAVSQPEKESLRSRLGIPLVHIPNAVAAPDDLRPKSPGCPLVFLFLGRLHHKKGLRPLIEGWERSEIWKSGDSRLIIAGPDDGEEAPLRALLKRSASAASVSLYGPAFGAEKAALFGAAHYFVLPSHSEGFPTSVLEAMRSGLVPIISDGCNFPEALQERIALRAGPCRESVATALRASKRMPVEAYEDRSRRAKTLIARRYSISVVAEQLARLVRDVLSNPGR